MAVTKIALELDKKLIEDGTISKEFIDEYSTVHKKLNKFIRQTGKELTAENFEKGDEFLRNWLNILYKQGASQEKLTNYLRCGLAHLSYDYISTQVENKPLPIDELITRSLKSFKSREFDTTYFKVSLSKMDHTINLVEKKEPKKTVRKQTMTKTEKKPAAKKTETKKTAVKKADTKKTAVKKTETKKAPVKKAPAKKAETKKTAVKKTTEKKPAAKKPVTKKTAVKKADTKKTAVKKTPAKKTVSKKTVSKKAGSSDPTIVQ